MKKMLPLILFIWAQQMIAQQNHWVIVIHGGAGNITPSRYTFAEQVAYKNALTQALEAGSTVLKNGGSSLDAVVAAVVSMENCPLFNAGRGAVLTQQGMPEMDASVMDGSNLKAGSVAGVSHIKNPVLAAKLVMDSTKHVMIAGKGAEVLAQRYQLPMADTGYFITPEVKKSWEKNCQKMGTVGAVALDMKGNLAAATSTGGMMCKMPGRIGDSPLIGAGTYANNKTCAVSCTGHGEFFIRNMVAYDISALMEYKGLTLDEAANWVILKKLKALNADGGLIAVDVKGNFVMKFNTAGMFRGMMNSKGETIIKLFTD